MTAFIVAGLAALIASNICMGLLLYVVVNRRVKSVVSRSALSLREEISILALKTGCLEVLDKRQRESAAREGNLDYSTDPPVHLQEKEYWLATRLYADSRVVARVTDKVTFKDYIREQLGDGFTPTTLGVWDRPEEIDFSGLPDRFALKSTIGYGNNHTLIVTNKAAFLRNPPLGELKRWTYRDFPLKAATRYPSMLSYRALKPRIIAEELLLDDDGRLPNDYKFLCVLGVPKMMAVMEKRFNAKGDKTQPVYSYFDAESGLLTELSKTSKARGNPALPHRFEAMKKLAATLARPFPCVRIDCYDLPQGIFVGEITIVNGTGADRREPMAIYDAFGEDLDVKNLNLAWYRKELQCDC